MARASYFPASLRPLQVRHRRFPPVPAVQYFFSMLLPSVHLLLLWYTSIPGLLECQGLTFVILLTSSLNRLAQHGVPWSTAISEIRALPLEATEPGEE